MKTLLLFDALVQLNSSGDFQPGQWNGTQGESQVWRGEIGYISIDSLPNQWVPLVENAHLANLSW